MNKRVKVSVLVPIYNVEEFLGECLDSLVNQTLKEIEIICINDGSTDSSLKIIKDYAKRDDRIVIIDKKNSGYGGSMNKGLEKATGEYIGIVESDDFIDRDAFEIMYKTASRNKVEVLKSNYYDYFGEFGDDMGGSSLFLPDETEHVVNPRINRNIFLQQPSIWAAIYSNNFIKKNGIKFLPSPGASYQDLGFNFKVWASATRAYFMERSFLHYRNDNSNSSVKSSGKIFAVKDEYEGIKKFLEDKNCFDELKEEYYTCRISSYIWNLDRLTYRAAKKFAPELRRTIVEAERQGAIGKDTLLSTANPNYRTAKHPKRYLIKTRLKKGLGAFAPKLLKIFPTYRHRVNIIKHLEELQKSQKRLVKQVEKLKNENIALKKQVGKK